MCFFHGLENQELWTLCEVILEPMNALKLPFGEFQYTGYLDRPFCLTRTGQVW
jgi:hypothetical protein